jgi:hypothetical protein
VAAQRSEAHDQREAAKFARELEEKLQRKARSDEEKRLREAQEERRRQSAEHAAQAAATAAALEQAAPWPPNEGSDEHSRALRETEKAANFARLSENRAQLCEKEEERMRPRSIQMKSVHIGDLIQRGDDGE